ncbi:hypothetical protein N2152v2_000264 [Parachlorella kessleri]
MAEEQQRPLLRSAALNTTLPSGAMRVAEKQANQHQGQQQENGKQLDMQQEVERRRQRREAETAEKAARVREMRLQAAAAKAAPSTSDGGFDPSGKAAGVVVKAHSKAAPLSSSRASSAGLTAKAEASGLTTAELEERHAELALGHCSTLCLKWVNATIDAALAGPAYEGQPLSACQLPLHSMPPATSAEEQVQQQEAVLAQLLTTLQHQQAENAADKAALHEELAKAGSLPEEQRLELEESLRLVAAFEEDLLRGRSEPTSMPYINCHQCSLLASGHGWLQPCGSQALEVRALKDCGKAHFSTCRQLTLAAVSAQQDRSSSSSNRNSNKDENKVSKERVAAILRSAGLDPAELQQQRPDEYSQLTLPLAQVLAQVQSFRVATAVGTLWVKPGDLMARICFLAYQAAWAAPAVVDGVIAWLEAEPLGFSTAEVMQQWQSSPALFATPAATLQRNLQGLLSRFSMDKQQLQVFVRGQCNVLWTDYEFQLAKLDILLVELPGLEPGLAKRLVHGFTKELLAGVLLRDKQLLVSSLDGKLQPLLAALERVLGSRQAVVGAVRKAPPLLGMSLCTLYSNVKHLGELGLSESEILDSISRQPQLFTMDYMSPPFQDKLRYFEVVLGRCPRDMFLQFPGYLLSGLHKIDYRASFLERKGDPRVETTLSWIIFSDKVLCQQYGYSLEEYARWEKEWLQSNRAKEYCLDMPAQRGMKKAQAARLPATAAVSAQQYSSGSSNIKKGEVNFSGHDKVAAILANAGLDPAELQQQRPEDYARLTVPLAQVLAEVHAARIAKAVGKLMVQPAELMGRICFLAYQVGLTAGDLRLTLQRYPGYLAFDVEAAKRLLGWLQLQQVSTSELRLASLAGPSFWSVDVIRMQRGKQHLQQKLSVTDRQWAQALATEPRAAWAAPEVVDDVIAWLTAAPLGFSMAEVAQLWQSSPVLFASPGAMLQRNLQGLLSRCPMDTQQLRSFMRGRCKLLLQDFEGLLEKLDSLLAELPGLEQGLTKLLVHGGSLLFLSWESLSGKLAYLQTYGFTKEQLARQILTSDTMLSNSLEGKLQPVLAALEGVLGSRQAVVGAVSRAPQLLGMSLNTLDSNVKYLRELGLSDSEIRGSVSRQPQLFCSDYVSLHDKLRYFDVVLGRRPRDMFLQYQSYLKAGLKRIDYRASFLERKGDPRVRTTLSWITPSDTGFCQRYGYSLEEFVGWEEEWVQSERVRKYGLDTPAETGLMKAHAARDRGRRARVAARRQQVLGDEGQT